MASFPFILAFCAFHSVWFALLRDQWLLPSYLRKFGGLLVWLGLSLAYAGLTRRLPSAYAGGAGSFWQTSKSRRNPNPWCLKCHVLLPIPVYYIYSNYDKILRIRESAYAAYATMRIFRYCASALMRSLSSSPFFIFHSFQKKTLLLWGLAFNQTVVFSRCTTAHDCRRQLRA